MRLPGTRYQEHGWEHVRKLLGLCSLPALRRLPPAQLADPALHQGLLDDYISAVTAVLRAQAHTARGQAAGNSYGESVHELALGLVFELQAYPSAWQAFMTVLAAEQARGATCGVSWDDPAAEGALRKKINDMYAGLRDRVDADHYSAATGSDCSPNKIYTYRMLDTAWREIARLFDGWHDHREQVGEILGRALHASPIEARQATSIRDCKAEWIIRWSAGLAAHGGAPGPLHTRSKRFASLKNNPARIAAMLAEIADYEELSSNRDSAEPWQGDAGAAALWLDDYWRVIGESFDDEAQGGAARADCLLPAPAVDADDSDRDDEPLDDGAELLPEAELDAAKLLAEQQAACALSLPLRYMELARAAQAGGSRTVRILHEESLAIRLAVYHKLLGAADDSYPDAWRDPATGELPTLQQLAALDGISMPTLRKRRNLAIDKLHAASAVAAP